MDADPGQVIRALRLALDMNQTEFARAAGWSPSTISSWERGRAKPSRLAFKTILAFAEERGVRYRPPAAGTTLLPAPTAAPSSRERSARASAPPGPRPALRPLVYPDPSPHPEAVAPREAPRWSAEASFRVTLGARRPESSRGVPRGVIEVATVVAAFCLALGLQQPLRQLLSRTTPARPATTAAAPPDASAAHGAALTSAAAPIELAAIAAVPPASRAAATTDGPDTTMAARSSGETAAAPLPASARLDSVIAIGSDARATFRTANDAVTVVVGEWLGAQRVAAIDAEGVTLVNRTGVSRHVRVGQHTALE